MFIQGVSGRDVRVAEGRVRLGRPDRWRVRAMGTWSGVGAVCAKVVDKGILGWRGAAWREWGGSPM